MKSKHKTDKIGEHNLRGQLYTVKTDEKNWRVNSGLIKPEMKNLSPTQH